MRSFVIAADVAGDPVKALPVLRFLEKEDADAAFFFGDVTGPLLSDGERVLYRQARDLLQETADLPGKIMAARALLSRPGLAEPYREALAFYLKEIADLSPEGEVRWQGSYRKALARLSDLAARLAPYPSAILADTAACEEAFAERLLDYDTLTLEGKTLKAVGLAPQEGLCHPAPHTPVEFRQPLRRAEPFSRYLASFDILVANALAPSLEAVLERVEERLTILPGSAPDVSDFEKTTLAFEAPGAFSHYRVEGDRLFRNVHRFSGGRLRLIRQDTFDLSFKLLRTKTDIDRGGSPQPAARRPEATPPAAATAPRRRLADVLNEAKSDPAQTGGSRPAGRVRHREGSGALMRFLRTPVSDLLRLRRPRRRPVLVDLPIRRVRDNPDPLREHLDEQELSRLAQSIREFGVIVPIIVKRAGNAFEVVAGQRRLTAARAAGLSTIPAIVREMDDQESAEVCYLENLHRVDLKPVEDAEAFERLVWELHEYTRGQLARRLGLDPDEIKIHEEILRMPVILREAMSMGLLDLPRARILAAIEDEGRRTALLRRAIREGLAPETLAGLAGLPPPREAAPPEAAGG